ncbi:MAG: hypothetical protein QNJ33_04565 [Crocosphaera sp.]|nr:hypothetical protein [Crocosphaera sp.]
MGETAAIGLTLGSGALVAGATRGSMAVRGLVRLGISAERAASAVLWADRAAFAIGLITTAIRDHRGWIIEHFGDAGRQFLDYVDLTHRMVAIYGMARFVLEMGGLLNSFRSASRNWRRASAEAERELSSTQRQAVQDINRHTDEFLDNANQIERASSRGPDRTGTGEQVVPSEAIQEGAALQQQRRTLLGTLEARIVQIRQARGDINVFRGIFRRLASDGNTPQSLDDVSPTLQELLTPHYRVRTITGGGRSGTGISTYIESLDGQFSIRITHNQVGATPIGRPPGPRIHIYEGPVRSHGSHVRLPEGTTLTDILNALGI